jgi:hypothetical protein
LPRPRTIEAPPGATVDVKAGGGTDRGKYISEAHRQGDLGSSGLDEQT